MKNLILLLLLFIVFNSCAQKHSANPPVLPIDAMTHRITFSDTVSAPGISKDILYTCLKKWFIDNSPTENTTLQSSDRDSGVFIGKGKFTKYCIIKDPSGAEHPIDFRVTYSINILVKNNASYITLKDFIGTAGEEDHIGAEITSMYKAIKYYQSKKMTEQDKQVSQSLIDVLEETKIKATGVLASIKRAVR